MFFIQSIIAILFITKNAQDKTCALIKINYSSVLLPVSIGFIVGNTQEEEVLFPIMKYYHVFANSLQRIIMYYSLPCKQNS